MGGGGVGAEWDGAEGVVEAEPEAGESGAVVVP